MIAYYPQHLHAQLEKLKQEFNEKQDYVAQFSNDDLEALIMKIVNCDASELRFYTYSLTRRELACIASYIPINGYKVKRKNLLMLFAKSDKFSYFETIYKGWQNNYKKRFFPDDIGAVIYHFQGELKNKYHLDAESLLKWMSLPDADFKVCRYVLNEIKLKSEMTMEDCLEYIGISSGSKLGKDVLMRKYFVCGIEEYRKLGDSDFRTMLHPMAAADATAILRNFLEVMTPKDYQTFYKTSGLAKDCFGVPDTTKYNQTVGQMSEKAKRSYTAWINYYWLIEMFGSDARSQFWKNYIGRFTAKHYPTHNILAMEFENIVAIEFMEMGYAYLYDKQVFHRYVEMHIHRDITVEFKQYLNNQSQYLFRKKHGGNWQWDMANQLAREGIVRD